MPPPEKLGPPVDAEEARKAFAAEEVPAFLPLPDGFAGAAAELDGRGRTGMKRESGGERDVRQLGGDDARQVWQAFG
jgi:hypothetical protein